MHTIYSNDLITVQFIKYIHTFVRRIPWTISWWGYRGSMKCHCSCSPPLRWHLLLLLLITLPFVRTTNLQEQPRTAKWCCAMTFLVGERVSCVIMRINPLINQESHCTASFCGSWLFLQICCLERKKCLGLKHQRRWGWQGWTRGRQQGEPCARRHFSWCHPPMWRSIQW